jgi:hypothetical protein
MANRETQWERNLRQVTSNQRAIRVVIDPQNQRIQRGRGALKSLAESWSVGRNNWISAARLDGNHQVNLDSQISLKGKDPTVLVNPGTKNLVDIEKFKFALL